MDLPSPSERSRKRWNRLSLVPPLMGFECALPPAYPEHVHSQEPRLPSGRRCHAPTRVPPSWFRTTSMVCSVHGSRVCCTPQPVKGSPRFVLAALPGHPKATRWDGCSPRDAVHTLRRLPLASSRTASLRPLPSCRYRPARRWVRPRPGFPCRPPSRRGGWRTPRGPYPRVAGGPAPGGGVPVSREMGGPGPPRRSGYQLVPGARGSEELRLPGRSWSPCPSRGGGAGPPRRSGFPAPVGGGAVLRGARCPVPDGAWRAMPRGAPLARSR